MTERDHYFLAVRFIYNTKKMVVSIKFCTEHIIRNAIHSYNITKQNEFDIRKIIMTIQQAITLENISMGCH